jgi:hypothetical protein
VAHACNPIYIYIYVYMKYIQKLTRAHVMMLHLLKNTFYQALVAHICNPIYSGGRDQEDCSSKPAQANSS